MGELKLKSKHRLLCGDSTSESDVARLMDGEKADMCFTSPPYSDMRDYGGECDLSVEHLAEFIPTAKPHCTMFVVNLGLQRKDGEIYSYWDEYIKSAKDCGLPFTSWNVWSRRGMGGSVANMTAMFPIEHEWLFVFGGKKEQVARTRKNKHGDSSVSLTNRQKDGKTKKAKDTVVRKFSRIGTVFESHNRGETKDHPASYPVALPSEYIEACCKKNHGVYDPFMGSGTTLIACEQLNRQCYGMEIDPLYCDVIVKRWENLTGETAHLESVAPIK
jgi:DNA modification methylase